MPKRPAAIPALVLPLDPEASAPLHRQLYSGLRTAILAGRLRPGSRLSATRVLAKQFAISRTTVLNAFDQLLAEGYLESKVGAGTTVAEARPDELLHVENVDSATQPSLSRSRALSRRGATLAATPANAAPRLQRPRAFRPCLPALDVFPFKIWGRIAAQRYRRPPSELLEYGQPGGYPPLREAIADYLQAARGVRCSAEQVIVVSGAQQGLDLAARVLLDPGDCAWVEEPGYLGARGVLRGAGVQIVGIPVDNEGLDVVAGRARAPKAKLAYVTPSHQFPLGVTMSLARRLALLAWASKADAWILEDDYDSEYRYAGRPLAALQGLDADGHVIYIGTFSKVLFPGLRLGYLVVPPDMIDAFTAARALTDRHAPSLEQAIVADFMLEGHFGRHIRRTRELYAERQAALVEMVQHELAGLLAVSATEAGMHLIGWLPASINDRDAAAHATAHALDTPPLSNYYSHRPQHAGVLLGYTAVSVPEIRTGVQQLAQAWSKLPGLTAAYP